MEPVSSILRSMLPAGVKRYLREAHQQHSLDRALTAFRRLPPEASPAEADLERAVYGWGNPGWSVRSVTLDALFSHGRGPGGPILDCGSGLSTLILGILAERSGTEVWTLEHDPVWAAQVQRALSRNAISGVHLCVAPLRDYGDFTWYSPPLKEMPSGFRLVLCDGPPGDTPGGRSGMLPVMRKFLAPGCVILLDDLCIEREERQIAANWAQALGTEALIEGDTKPCATILVPGA